MNCNLLRNLIFYKAFKRRKIGTIYIILKIGYQWVIICFSLARNSKSARDFWTLPWQCQKVCTDITYTENVYIKYLDLILTQCQGCLEDNKHNHCKLQLKARYQVQAWRWKGCFVIACRCHQLSRYLWPGFTYPCYVLGAG